MERPFNLSCDSSLSSAENHNHLSSSSSSSSSLLSFEGHHQQAGAVRDIQARPLRFRYPLVSLKRLRTLGPPRRVLVSDTEAGNSLPKISEEENDVSPKEPSSGEKDHVEASIKCQSDEDFSSQLEKAVSSLGQISASGCTAQGIHEHPEHRKRKADIERIAEDTTISLTLNMESSGSPSENSADLRLGCKGHDYFGTGGFNSRGNLVKSIAEHNNSVNSYIAFNDEVNPYPANGKIGQVAASKCHLKQPQKAYDASIASDHLKPMVQDVPKKVHFATLDYSNKGDFMEFPNSLVIDTESKQAHSAVVDQQSSLKSRNLLKVATDGGSVPLSSSTKDDSINKMNRLLDSVSSTPLVSVNSEACEKTTTDTGVENLSSHLNSLALTENQECGSLSNLGESFASHQQNLKQICSAPKYEAYSSKEVQTTKTNGTATTTMSSVDQILKPRVSAFSRIEANNSSTLSGAASLSSTASAFGVSNSTSVPCTSMLSSSSAIQNLGPCKDLSSSRERGAVGEASRDSKLRDPTPGLDDFERHFNFNIRNSSAPSSSVCPCTSSSFACQSATSIRCTSGPLTSLSIGQGFNVSIEQSGTAKANSGKSLSEDPTNARVQEPRVVTKSIEERVPQEPHVTSKANEGRNQVPEVASTINKSVQQSSSGSGIEKALAPNNRETGMSRKKYYDPDAFFRVNNKIYQKLGKIGSGGSSEVHKVISSDCTIYALKKIKLKGRDYSTAYGFCQEIDYLTRLRGKNYIIQLIDYEVTDKSLFRDVTGGELRIKDGRINEDAYIYMVLEYGEIDLAQMLIQKWREMDAGKKQIDENWLRFYWQQILKAVNTIHEERIVHSDLKPANFLLVKGVLKLIDFGIAKAIQSDTTNIQRESQVGTLNYMSPEAFLCNDLDENGNIIKCGRPSDIWSLGCILYQMVYGKTPFADYTTFWAKYKEITNKDHKITYGPVSNPWLLDIMERCLAWNRNERLRIPQLLEHPFLRPPPPPLLVTQEEQHCNALLEISNAYGSDGEIRRLCENLQERIRTSSKHLNR
uniref:Monopolar spindle 1 n=1 Tax=Araucaria angustifolia TaxID=56992 RepID=A0A165R3M6_ARAAG|nr:monopolar spindle 1 [Araucaria angustifolia]